MTKIKNVVNKSCSSNLVFLRENHFLKDYVDIWPQKLTLNFENAPFWSARHYSNVQDINVSFEYAVNSYERGKD